jgi:hypothetical protein
MRLSVSGRYRVEGQRPGDEDAARGTACTVCYEVRILGAAFSVAVDDELLAVRPVFKLPSLRNARSGFFEDGDFAALLLELPAYVRPVVRCSA